MRTDAEIHELTRDLILYTATPHNRIRYWKEIELILEALRIFIFYQV